jgi:hypothetical protein
MTEKPEEQTNPSAENDELADSALEQVAGGVGLDPQEPMQAEEPQGSAVDKAIMKTKHDTVKNSISNVR